MTLSNFRAVSVVLALACVAISGCRRRENNAAPSIEFTRVPKSDEGGSGILVVIEGRVNRWHAGDQIVLFARGSDGVWWVQPFAKDALTVVQADTKWKNSTHLGLEYAAILVKPGYRPPPTMPALPAVGGSVAAVASVKGEGSPRVVSRTLHFSGYEWEIRQIPSNRGGKLNTYDPSNAWTDTNGWLHLRVAQSNGGWTCAEVILTRSLGYGSYRFVVQTTSELEPAIVLGMFTWDDSSADQNHRELDIELSRWGDPNSKNAQYVVQPFYVPANVVRFMTPSGILTHSFHWEPGRASFKTVAGGSHVIAEHTFTSGVPSSGGESARINLYPFDNKGSPLRNSAEVVIEKFEYLP
jgi:hypothetical protein